MIEIRLQNETCYRCGLNEKTVKWTKVPFRRLDTKRSICEHCQKDKQKEPRNGRA